MDGMLEQTATRIFADHAADPAALWDRLEENGLTLLWVEEANGGFDLAPAEGFGLMMVAALHAAPVPLAETLVATWFLREAGLQPPPGPLSFLVSKFQRGILFGGIAEHIVRIDGTVVSLHRGASGRELRGIGEDPLSCASSLGDDPLALGSVPFADGLHFAALARSAQVCGALEAVLRLTIEFAGQRVQFGRPIAQFQAIQHLLSEMGAETAAAIAALNAAIATVHPGRPLDRTAIAVAKYRSALAAGIVAEHAHQVHGAIGYTHEYQLARFTRRIWQWREDFGSESYWAHELGSDALAEPGPLWPRLIREGDA